MNWRSIQLTYELRSPLHIGYHKVGNMQRTRCYIPARNLWGAVTERLTRSGFTVPDAQKGDYRKIGGWLKKFVAFSYFYLYEGDKLLNPFYCEGGLRYGNKTTVEFERAYLDAHVTTALEPGPATAEMGSLHEVEYIAPYRTDEDDPGLRTLIQGLVFLGETACSRLNGDTWGQWLSDLYVGGERRYGFGQLRLKDLKEINRLPDCLEEYELKSEGQRPGFKITSGAALLAHTVTRDLDVKGAIEPLVGRKTATSTGFGRDLTKGQICWVPGSVLRERATFMINEDGCWEQQS